MALVERVVIDTSAFYALLSSGDLFHDAARDAFEVMIDREQEMWTTSYALVETMALVHRRLGFAMLSRLVDYCDKNLEVLWVDSELHSQAWDRLESSQGENLGFVDWTVAIGSRLLDAHVFTFDRGFARQGIAVLPR